MKYQLRPYQIEAVKTALSSLTSGKPRPTIMTLGTGAGKSLIIGAICHELTKLDAEAGVLVLAPSKELLEQDEEKLKAYGIDDIKVYSASAGEKEVGQYTIATIGSIYKKPELFRHVKYVLIDETDLVSISADGMYAKFFDKLHITRILGLTATPYKMRIKTFRRPGFIDQSTSVCMMNRFPPVKGTLGPRYMWGSIVYKMEMKELQKAGYLCPIKYYSELPKAQLRLNSTGGDYRKEDIQAFGEQSWNRILSVLIALLRRDNPKRVLVFCPSVKASQKLSEKLREYGVKADHVDGKTPKKERTEKIDRFKSGETQVMCNCQCLTAGFDLPALDCIVYARPTISPRVWSQAVGRGVRLDPDNPNKTLTVYDLVGCCYTIGRVEDIKLAKEGFKDALIGTYGRIDNRPLKEFSIDIARVKAEKEEREKMRSKGI